MRNILYLFVFILFFQQGHCADNDFEDADTTLEAKIMCAAVSEEHKESMRSVFYALDIDLDTEVEWGTGDLIEYMVSLKNLNGVIGDAESLAESELIKGAPFSQQAALLMSMMNVRHENKDVFIRDFIPYVGIKETIEYFREKRKKGDVGFWLLDFEQNWINNVLENFDSNKEIATIIYEKLSPAEWFSGKKMDAFLISSEASFYGGLDNDDASTGLAAYGKILQEIGEIDQGIERPFVFVCNLGRLRFDYLVFLKEKLDALCTCSNPLNCEAIATFFSKLSFFEFRELKAAIYMFSEYAWIDWGFVLDLVKEHGACPEEGILKKFKSIEQWIASVS